MIQATWQKDVMSIYDQVQHFKNRQWKLYLQSKPGTNEAIEHLRRFRNAKDVMRSEAEDGICAVDDDAIINAIAAGHGLQLIASRMGVPLSAVTKARRKHNESIKRRMTVICRCDIHGLDHVEAYKGEEFYVLAITLDVQGRRNETLLTLKEKGRARVVKNVRAECVEVVK